MLPSAALEQQLRSAGASELFFIKPRTPNDVSRGTSHHDFEPQIDEHIE